MKRLFFLFLLLSTNALAQTSFFVLWPGHPSFSPLPTPNIRALEAEYQIAVDVRALASNNSARRLWVPLSSARIRSGIAQPQ